jgi:hypothetical protein
LVGLGVLPCNFVKKEYYDEKPKNLLFKKQQKFDCATSVMSGLNEMDVFANVFIVKENSIVFNYPVFKTVANPYYYEKMADYLFLISSQLIDLPRTRDDSSSLLSSAGLTLRSILRHLDESAGFKVVADENNEYHAGYRIEYASGNVHRTSYEFHRLCKCSGLEEI